MSKKGQSTIEYLLLLGMVLIVMLGIIKSTFFQNFFGEEGQVFVLLNNAWEHSYRHGFSGNSKTSWNDDFRYRKPHESYFFNSTTRFFFPKIYDGRP